MREKHLQIMISIYELSGAADLSHTVINCTEPSRGLSRLTNLKARRDQKLTFGVFVNGNHDLQMFFAHIAWL
jgi:hypothetical protein